MIRLNHILTAGLMLAASAVSASAHDYRYGNDTSDIDARRASEIRRIEEGRRSGQLSWREYRFLKAEQARIAEHERQAKTDGYVSPDERRRLNRELDQASADIYRLKHNDEVAGRRHWYRWW